GSSASSEPAGTSSRDFSQVSQAAMTSHSAASSRRTLRAPSITARYCSTKARIEIFARSTFCARARSSSRSNGPSNPSSFSSRLSPAGAAWLSLRPALLPASLMVPGEPEGQAEPLGQNVFQHIADRVDAEHVGQHQNDDNDNDQAVALQAGPGAGERFGQEAND